MQDREREIDTLSVRRPQPHTTNLYRVFRKNVPYFCIIYISS